MGIGGSTEAVLRGGRDKILGGQMLARFKSRDEKYQDKFEALMKSTPAQSEEDIHRRRFGKGKRPHIFTATGVIDSFASEGVHYTEHAIITHPLVIRGQTETMRYVTTHHHR